MSAPDCDSVKLGIEAAAPATPDVIEEAGLDEESVQMAIETTKVDCGDPGHNVSEIIEELYAEYRALRAERDRYRALVKEAYIEGADEAEERSVATSNLDYEAMWKASIARRALAGREDEHG